MDAPNCTLNAAIDSIGNSVSESIEAHDDRIDAGYAKFRWLFARTAPYLGAVGAVTLATTLLTTIYFTWLSLPWVTFLSGMLAAAVLSIASSSAKAEWLVARRTAQLALTRDKLARETRLRARAEHALLGVSKSATHLDNLLPAMLAHIDKDQCITYHNRAFQLWLGLSASHISDRPLREVFGSTRYAEFADAVTSALSGHQVHDEKLHVGQTGEVARLLGQWLPQFGDHGQVCGVFLILTDITQPKDAVAGPPALDCREAEKIARCGTSAVALTHLVGDTEWLSQALEGDKFCLYSQTIKPLQSEAGKTDFKEVLLRLNEEEDGLLHPGYFLGLAEQHGMLPQLDRWVTRNLIRWISQEEPCQAGIYSINLAKETIADRDFPHFLRNALRESGVSGAALCFEFQESDLLKDSAAAANFARDLKKFGCRTSICGFGANHLSIQMLELFSPDYIKIDSALVLNMLRSPADLARVKAVNTVAHLAGISTIAECVENQETIEKLSALKVDFAQGFGVSRPRRMQATHDTAMEAPHATVTSELGLQDMFVPAVESPNFNDSGFGHESAKIRRISIAPLVPTAIGFGEIVGSSSPASVGEQRHIALHTS